MAARFMCCSHSVLRQKKARESPKARNAQRRSRGRGLPWSSAPGAAPGRAWRQRHRVAAPRTAKRGGAASLPGSGGLIIQVFSQFAHLCIGNEGREESGWEAAAFRMQMLFFFFFFSFLKQVLSRHYKNYICMILTFYNLLLPLRTWPV